MTRSRLQRNHCQYHAIRSQLFCRHLLQGRNLGRGHAPIRIIEQAMALQHYVVPRLLHDDRKLVLQVPVEPHARVRFEKHVETQLRLKLA